MAFNKKKKNKEKKGGIIESETSNVVVMGVLLDTQNRVNRLDPRPWYHYAIVWTGCYDEIKWDSTVLDIQKWSDTNILVNLEIIKAY